MYNILSKTQINVYNLKKLKDKNYSQRNDVTLLLPIRITKTQHKPIKLFHFYPRK